MIGDSKEEVGFDVSSSIDIMAQIANRARRTLPILENSKSYVAGQPSSNVTRWLSYV